MRESDSDKEGSKFSNDQRTDRSEVRYIPVEYVQAGREDEDEIDLLDLIRILWEGRGVILKSILVGLFIGLFVYLFSAKEYESEAILIQEQNEQQVVGNALFQQFSSGAIERQSEGIPSSLYPRIIESAEFQLKIVNREVEFESLDTTLTALDYFNHYYSPPITKIVADGLFNYTVKLPATLYRHFRNIFRGDQSLESIPVQEDLRFFSLSLKERRALSLMKERVMLERDGSLLTFRVQMPDSRAAAELNYFVIGQIQEYITDYRIEKYRQTLEYVKKQFEDAKQRYEEAQLALARFNDQNIRITTAVARTQQEDLQNRRNITYNVYNNLAQQVERSRTRLQEETPVFSVLQKPLLPHAANSKSVFIIGVFVLSGLALGFLVIFGFQMWISFKDKVVK